MSLLKEPAVKAPWPPDRDKDPLYRWPKRYRVGETKGETFASIAKASGVGAKDLVLYNFRTTSEKEVNWYLENYVGCRPPGPGQRHYSFAGAVYDEKKNKGVIFIPRFGSPISQHVDRFGNKVVENYNNTRNKEPGGSCYVVAYDRVREASNTVGGAVPVFDKKSEFGRLWGSLISPKKTWLELPEEYRGKGAAGAVASVGAGTLVEQLDIWAGKLKPGALVQTWKVAGDFKDVRDGDAPTSYGHSFVFLNYVYSGSAISGMAIADQGFQNSTPLKKSDYGYWVAANLKI